MGKTTMKRSLVTAFTVSAMLGLGAQSVMAQDDVQPMPGMNDGSMSNMDMDSMQDDSMSNMDNDSMQDKKSQSGMNGSSMPNMDSGSMQNQKTMPGMNGDSSSMGSSGMQGQGTMPGMNMQGNGSNDMADNSTAGGMTGMSAMNADAMNANTQPSDTRDPHAYSDGYTLASGDYALPGPRQMHLADEKSFASLLVDRLETVHTSDNIATAYDMQAWIGRDYDRAMLRAEGDYTDDTLEEAKTELFWSHAVSSFWDALVGVRYDSSAEGPDRKWLALGVQGLAPYWFEFDATAYAGEEERSALTLNAEYEMLLTQKLILQPALEANFYGKDDPERGTGTGLSDVVAGLRLRYEIRREIAPYIGVEWAGLYGGTADYANTAGMDTDETRAVAGLRFWF